MQKAAHVLISPAFIRDFMVQENADNPNNHLFEMPVSIELKGRK